MRHRYPQETDTDTQMRQKDKFPSQMCRHSFYIYLSSLCWSRSPLSNKQWKYVVLTSMYVIRHFSCCAMCFLFSTVIYIYCQSTLIKIIISSTVQNDLYISGKVFMRPETKRIDHPMEETLHRHIRLKFFFLYFNLSKDCVCTLFVTARPAVANLYIDVQWFQIISMHPFRH